CTGGKRNVDAVIDDELRVSGTARQGKHFCLLVPLPERQALAAILQYRHASLERFHDTREKLAAVGNIRRDGIEPAQRHRVLCNWVSKKRLGKSCPLPTRSPAASACHV